MLELKKISSEENFQSLYISISKHSSKIFSEELRLKYKKSNKFMKCTHFSFEHVGIFTVSSKFSCNSNCKTRRKRRRLKRPYIPPDIPTVHNLSKIPLTVDQKSLLEKNLKFCPTPHIMDRTAVKADNFNFLRKMRWKEFFHGADSTSNEKNESSQNLSKFGIKSQSIPP